MTKVVFLGDKPSKLNISERIPFIGAKSFDTLIKWIKVLRPDYYLVVNQSSVSPIEVMQLRNKGFKFVALGNNASDYLKDFSVDHYKLPHPSGLNRKLNDILFIETELMNCMAYISNFDQSQNERNNH